MASHRKNLKASEQISIIPRDTKKISLRCHQNSVEAQLLIKLLVINSNGNYNCMSIKDPELMKNYSTMPM